MRQLGAAKCWVFPAAPRQKDATRCKIGPEDPHLRALLAGGDKEAKAGVFRSSALRTPGLGCLRAGYAWRKPAGSLLSCQHMGTACSVSAEPFG